MRWSRGLGLAAWVGLALAPAPGDAGNEPSGTLGVGATLETGAVIGETFFPYTVDVSSLHSSSSSPALQRAPEREESKRFRRLLALAGGVGGFLAYAPVAIDDSRIGVSDSQRLLEWSAVTAGAAVVGYLIGKQLDRR